jgi:hypothetical protein
MAMKNSLDKSPGCTSFFYGLLLMNRRLKKETLYQNQKRWMLNRLVWELESYAAWVWMLTRRIQG